MSSLFQVKLNDSDLRLFTSPESQPAFDPKNCGAVTGQLLGLVSSKVANEMTIFRQGVYPDEWINYISSTIGSKVTFKYQSISKLQSFFDKALFPGFGTILAIYPKEGSGHWFVMAKTIDNRLVALDPQVRQWYTSIESYFKTGSWVPYKFGVFYRDRIRTQPQHETDNIAFLAKAFEQCSIASGDISQPPDVEMEGSSRKRRKTKRRLLAKRTLRRMNRRRRIL